MRKIKARFLVVIFALCMLFQTSPALAQDVGGYVSLPEDLIPVVKRDRGTLDDLCRAGKKQYCAENRKKYERPMTDKKRDVLLL